MSNTIHFKRDEMVYSSYGGQPLNRAAICRLVGTDESQTMGAGIAYFDDISINWTVLYDELIVVLEGEFELVLGETTIAAKPGDVIWIPEKTPLAYSGKKAKVFYALYPVNWSN
ncbi:cupin domain-containing protein [Pseudomonas sp. Pseusp3]|uniref:cupin domain-containing protein n=1 Tax=unclassified Pseudomonas TaxID=196821 RepID=UPI0039AFAFEF